MSVAVSVCLACLLPDDYATSIVPGGRQCERCRRNPALYILRPGHSFDHPNALLADALHHLNTVEVDAEVLVERWGIDATALLKAVDRAKKAATGLAVAG